MRNMGLKFLCAQSATRWDREPCIGLDKGGHTFVTLEGEAIRARRKKEENLFYDGVDSIAAYESHFATCPAADEYRRKK